MNNSDIPAMPFEGGQNNNEQPYTGLTKREYFAGLAMNRIIAQDSRGIMSPEVTAGAAVRLADSLLAELELNK